MSEHFKVLNAINVNGRVEKKKVNGKELSYLSWAWAWAEVKKVYPDATYNIKHFGEAQLPYVFDPKTGYMVFTDVTIEGLTHSMWLTVMDGANKAMKDEPYTYFVKNWSNPSQPTEKTCDACDMFDINKALMRCLVKNLSMFGLGLYIYAGEDIPEGDKPEPELTPVESKPIDRTPAKDTPVSVVTSDEIERRTAEIKALMTGKGKTRAQYDLVAKGRVATTLPQKGYEQLLSDLLEAWR